MNNNIIRPHKKKKFYIQCNEIFNKYNVKVCQIIENLIN